MDDLISRQKAIEALDFKIVHMTGFSNDEKNITNPFAQYNKGLEDGIKAIRALPSTEPEEQTTKVYQKQAPDKLYYFYCGNCGEMIDCSFHEDYKSIKSYCGYCGAKLDWSK